LVCIFFLFVYLAEISKLFTSKPFKQGNSIFSVTTKILIWINGHLDVPGELMRKVGQESFLLPNFLKWNEKNFQLIFVTITIITTTYTFS